MVLEVLAGPEVQAGHHNLFLVARANLDFPVDQ